MPSLRIRTVTVADEPTAIVEGTPAYDTNDALSDAWPATLLVNESDAASPSSSVAVYVCAVAACFFVGVPDSVRVEALNVTPAGRVPVSA